MITLREDQVTTLAQRTVQNLRQRVHGSLAETFSEFSKLSIEERETFLATTFRHASQHGLAAEESIMGYVLAGWLLGPNFSVADENIARVLESSEIDEFEKAAWLDDYTVNHLRG